MPNIYQPQLEHLQVDPNQTDYAGNVSAKVAELRLLVSHAGDNPAVHSFPPGAPLASALTGNVDSTILVAQARFFTNDILVRLVTAVGATPTATFTIQSSKDNVTFTPVRYALIATPNTFVTTPFVITTAGTNIYRVAPHQAKYLKITSTANTNVTWTVDVIDYGGVPTNG